MFAASAASAFFGIVGIRGERGTEGGVGVGFVVVVQGVYAAAGTDFRVHAPEHIDACCERVARCVRQ